MPRSNDFKLKETAYKEEVFHNKVARCWERLSRRAVGAHSLKAFETRLDGPLGNLI